MSTDPFTAAINAAAESAVKRLLADLGITKDVITKPRDDGLIEASEVMRRLHFRSRSTLHRFIDDGRLKVVAKLGGKNMFRADDVEALKASASKPEAA